MGKHRVIKTADTWQCSEIHPTPQEKKVKCWKGLQRKTLLTPLPASTEIKSLID